MTPFASGCILSHTVLPRDVQSGCGSPLSVDADPVLPLAVTLAPEAGMKNGDDLVAPEKLSLTWGSGVGLAVPVAVDVGVWVAVGVFVADGVLVAVDVFVGVTVGVQVGVLVGVLVFVGVLVAVFVGV